MDDLREPVEEVRRIEGEIMPHHRPRRERLNVLCREFPWGFEPQGCAQTSRGIAEGQRAQGRRWRPMTLDFVQGRSCLRGLLSRGACLSL
jgi:hypothetical protein